jgi:hypothetical protein
MISIRNLTAIAAVGSIALLGACSDSDNPVASTEPGTANVQVVHASPNAPAVDIQVDNASPAAVDSLAYPNNTGYVGLTAGTRNVKVNVNKTLTSVINADVVLEAGKNYTVFAVDSVSKIAPLVLEDNLVAPAAGKAHVRFVHLSPDAPPVDIAVANGGPVVFSNVAFKGSVDFTPLDAGTYPLEVRGAGSPTPVLDLGNITLQDGKIYTVFAKGFFTGSLAVGNASIGAEIIVNN